MIFKAFEKLWLETTGKEFMKTRYGNDAITLKRSNFRENCFL